MPGQPLAFARFLDTLGRRLSQGRSFRDDIPLDIPAMRQRPADRTDDTPSRS
ncbi:hypothetical protein [Acetobacter syzygii]|uniref:hypothetical protein n=1 Tax=Acetobacter syzygii TaxID=146476 RepID=UPI0039EAC1C4